MIRALLFLPAAAIIAYAQPGCTFTITPTSVNVPARASTPDGSSNGVITVRASAGGCARTAVSAIDWISISFGTPGTGNGTVGYTVRQNRTAAPRTGTMLVAGLTFTVNQTAADCDFELAPSRTAFPSSGGAGAVNVTTTCTWEASSDVPWITLSGAGATGKGSFSFTVGNNPAAQQRTGRILVGDKAILITQAAAGCTYTLEPASADVAATGATGSIAVTAPAGCAWSAVSPAEWISITSGASSPGPITYNVSPNRTPEQRTASIPVAGASFTITQAPANCAITLAPASAIIPAAVTQGAFQVTTTCDWRATSDAFWISITSGQNGSGSGQVNYIAAENTSSQPRTGSIAVSGRAFALTQQAAACRITLTPQSATFVSSGGNATVAVEASAEGCTWDAVSNTEWIRVQAITRTGNRGTVNYSVSPSPDGRPRTGTITIAGMLFSVLQTEAGPEISSAGIVNAASFRPGAVSPGEIVTMFGLRLGPDQLAMLELTPDGNSITKELAGTRVYFDDEPAPMIYASAGQVSVIVPYATGSRQTTRVQLEAQEKRSNVVLLPVAPASPAIFTLNASGSGAGAILNQDFTVNSAANPAAPGSVVQIFATGEGVTEPPGIDGELVLGPLARPVQPVRVEIGGRSAEVLYAGSAPGLVRGVIQVNALVPEGVESGEAPVRCFAGGAASQPGVTLTIR